MTALLAMNDASQFLENSAKVTAEVAKGWDSAWHQTILDAPASSTYGQIVYIASLIWGIVAFVYIAALAAQHWQGSLAKKPMQAISLLLAPILIFMTLVNHASALGQASYFFNRFILYSDAMISQAQIGQVSLADAVKTIGLSGVARDRIQGALNACSSSVVSQPAPAPTADATSSSTSIQQNAQYQCYDKVINQINTLKAEFQQQQCGSLPPAVCQPAIQLFGDVSAGITAALSQTAQEVNQNGILNTNLPLTVLTELYKAEGNYITGNVTLAFLAPLMGIFQFSYVNFIVGGLFILGLTAPIFMAASLLNWQPRTCWLWLISYFHFGLGLLIYDALVGVVATILVSVKVISFTEIHYAVWIGLGAPALSTGLAFFSAWKAASDAKHNVDSLVGGAVSGVMHVVSLAILKI